MDWVIIVVIVAIIEYIFFGMMVGRARGKYQVPAPATSGHPEFERYFRVQQNTGEQLLAFLPAIFIYSHVGNPLIAAGAGLLFVVGRIVYFMGYVKDPKSRGTGFLMGFVAIAFLVLASLVAVIGNLL